MAQRSVCGKPPVVRHALRFRRRCMGAIIFSIERNERNIAVRLKDNLIPMLAMLACVLIFGLIEIAAAAATGCGTVLLEQGRVTQVIDARTLRLNDDREIRLAGITPPSNTAPAKAMLTALVANRDVVLRSDNETPDRYGRQQAFVTPADSDISVQAALLRAGAAILTGTLPAGGCATELAAAEAVALQAGQGVWNTPNVIKSTENPDDILAMLGQFALIKGKVLSVRQSGATFYLNFGRRWVRDFAVIIPRQMIGSLTRDGIDIRALAGRWVRVRGWIEQRGGPRIRLRGTGQIEVLDRQ